MAYELKDRTTYSNKEAQIGGNRDDIQLQRLGKKPVLKRNFGILSLLGFSCTILSTWEGLLGAFVEALENGGSAGAVYSFIYAWTGTGCCFIVLAELSSMAPTSGGQYHWLPFASASFMCGTQIQGVAILVYQNYMPQRWQGTLIVWCVLLVALGINVAGGKLLPRLESLILVVHILGFFGIMIPLVYMSDHNSAREVFLEFNNGGGFPTDGLSWFVGATGCVFAFAGGDAAVHMAEEVANASTAIPKAIITTVLINGSLGFGMLIAVLFSLGDIKAALNSSTGYPYMEIFYQATGSISGSAGMVSAMLVVGVASSVGMLAATSRQFWSFARDRGIPGWQLWSKVSSRSLPMYSIYITMTISVLLALINIGSPTALNDILSMAVSAIYTSYLVAGSLLLWRRSTGFISLYNDNDDMTVNLPGAKLVWGPFRVPGIWGILVNAYAVIYMIIVIFFSYWPSMMHPTVAEMNYSVVGTMGFLILAILYYFVWARRSYQGPVVEAMLLNSDGLKFKACKH
ncbi:hypothetical protein N7470_007731 [Penicillium chermesinum]|nr:hypothetical protein N7470_007731 [Penicillium chermesinum]